MDTEKLMLQMLSNEKTPFWVMYLTGFASACCAELVGYPFDVTKTRLQLQGEMANKTGQAMPKRGMFGTAMGIIREEGFFKLYGGLSAMVLRHSVFSGLKMLFYDYFRIKLITTDKDGKPTLSFAGASIAGVLAGSLASLLSSPTDLIKVQMQMESKRRLLGEPPRIHNVGQALTSIYSTGGIPGLWKGTVPNTWRAALVSWGDISFYDLSKRTIMDLFHSDDNRLIQFISSMTAGFAGAVLSTPADVVKSRIMNQPVDEKGRGLHYKGTLDCFSKLVKEEGLLAMYKGFMPYWLRVGPWSMVFWMSFEQIRYLTGRSGY